MKLENPDIVHGHHMFTPIPLAGIYFAKKLGKATILTNHSTSRPSLYFAYPVAAHLLQHVHQYADKVIAVSEEARRFATLFVDENRIVVIPNGVDTRKFCQSSNDREEGYFRADSNPIILSVGRLTKRKGVQYLIQAIPRVLSEVPDARFLIVGEGPERRKLERLARRLRISESITFTGQVSDQELSGFYARCTLFVFPSVYGESFGTTNIEAMACGKPVIASKVGGVPEIVENGDTGILLDPASPNRISEAIIQLLSDRDLARKLGRNGRRRIEERFCWRIVTRHVIETYKEALGTHCSKAVWV